MADASDRKLYLGPRLRMLRRELGINQTQMAEELGVSPSYLNHLERNQRPLTAQMLLRLANTYDIDVRDFVSGSGEEAVSSLNEMLADPLVRDIGIPRHEMLEVAESYPGMVEAITRFYRAVADFRRQPGLLQQMDEAGPVGSVPLDWLRDHINRRRNHIPELDEAAEALAAGLGDDPADLYRDLRERLQKEGVTVRIVPEEILAGAVRHYDFHRRRLMLSERLPASSRLFALGYQLLLFEFGSLLSDLIARAAPPDEETRKLLKVALANYAASAVVMPYGRFLETAERSGYDLHLLEARFGASFEQVAHRLTTLGRPNARGVPFFMLKVDVAGNISKRFSGEAFPFARLGGTCPRWNIHEAFQHPGKIVTQIVETTDGRRYFTLSRTTLREASPEARSMAAIGLGCELKHASRLLAAEGLDPESSATAIGPTCTLCERVACPDRALPPVTRSLEIEPHRKTAAPYPFRRV
jgi:XRE family transcriptional regulator, fatty acid utilization regulator